MINLIILCGLWLVWRCMWGANEGQQADKTLVVLVVLSDTCTCTYHHIQNQVQKYNAVLSHQGSYLDTMGVMQHLRKPSLPTT